MERVRGHWEQYQKEFGQPVSAEKHRHPLPGFNPLPV